MSIGYSAPSGKVRAALQYAYQHGVVLVASSGNSGHDDERSDHGFAPVSFPAEYPGVISVGALTSTDSAAGFSSNNLSVQVAAPGVRIPAQGRDGLYWTVDGTSPACALVAGVAALIKARVPRDLAGAGDGGADDHGAERPAARLQRANRVRHRGRGGGAAEGRPADARAPGGLAGQGDGALRRRQPAVPAAPVAPRGIGQLVLFTVFAVASLMLALAAVAGLAVLRRGAG